MYANAGTGGTAYDVTSVIDGVSGYPAKNRGIHFNGATNNGYIDIPNYMLDHFFSIHAWALVKTAPTAGNFGTLLSIDRNDFSSATSSK